MTLTASSNVFFTEYPWTPGELQQAMDRAHRIGQKNNVNVYYGIPLNTIVEKIAKMLDEKQKVLSAVLDGKKVKESNLISNLIYSYKNDTN